MAEVEGTGTLSVDPKKSWVVARHQPRVDRGGLGRPRHDRGPHDIGLTTLALLAGMAFIVRGTVELMAGFYMRQMAKG